ncbi:hypothetical protein BB561_001582 [Smittium simulii]|uniref:Glutamate pyruvate transaminase n=1 Tax=Smittium simulii TaxID=133385 RepID=A0A2T9YTZ9_9FUNG|nr:hypothetical protein BB561_001582 [Smittium simulii]
MSALTNTAFRRLAFSKFTMLSQTSTLKIAASFSTTSVSRDKVLTLDSINSRVRDMEYAVRGALPIRAEQIEAELKTAHKYPFSQTVYCNIGNPQQLGQQPITFLRQVSALVDYPQLLAPENKDKTSLLFPQDAIERASQIMSVVGSSVGAYSGSTGYLKIRQDVADFIEARDGYPSNPANIQLTNGASGAVERVLELIVSNPDVGIMIPIPQYPLYTASLTRFGAHAVSYYLKEEEGWGMDIAGLSRALAESKAKGIDVRAIVVINPGNPTGGVLSEQNMRDIVTFCENQNLVILADEVYQTNIFAPLKRPFVSFKKVVSEMRSTVELFSFHSISKGMIGECGRRGGYLEMHNISDSVASILYKMASVSLCSNVLGQIAIDIMVNPPKPADPSFDQYNTEIDTIYKSLKSRSQKLCNAFNAQENISCQPAQGSMYLFPQINLPKKFLDFCSKNSKTPDEEYCMRMLESTGVCVVPGSGFGQLAGTWHFRCTFLPLEAHFDAFIASFDTFHHNFMNEFRD